MVLAWEQQAAPSNSNGRCQRHGNEQFFGAIVNLFSPVARIARCVDFFARFFL